jgi:hypothetical protein
MHFPCALQFVCIRARVRDQKYDINARVNIEARSIDGRRPSCGWSTFRRPIWPTAFLLSSDNKPRVAFFLNEKAKLNTMSVNGVAVTPKNRRRLRATGRCAFLLI